MGKIINIQAADQGINRTQLIEQWRKLYGCSSPKYLSLRLMQSALAWEEQAWAMGSIPAKTLRTMRNASGPQTAKAITTLNAGAVLMREWNGRTYQVSVLKHGFRLDGKDYTSLTAIAKMITGAKWSGPWFFGLTGKRGGKTCVKLVAPSIPVNLPKRGWNRSSIHLTHSV